jgi:hypothetical protein
VKIMATTQTLTPHQKAIKHRAKGAVQAAAYGAVGLAGGLFLFFHSPSKPNPEQAMTLPAVSMQQETTAPSEAPKQKLWKDISLEQLAGDSKFIIKNFPGEEETINNAYRFGVIVPSEAGESEIMASIRDYISKYDSKNNKPFSYSSDLPGLRDSIISDMRFQVSHAAMNFGFGSASDYSPAFPGTRTFAPSEAVCLDYANAKDAKGDNGGAVKRSANVPLYNIRSTAVTLKAVRILGHDGTVYVNEIDDADSTMVPGARLDAFLPSFPLREKFDEAKAGLVYFNGAPESFTISFVLEINGAEKVEKAELSLLPATAHAAGGKEAPISQIPPKGYMWKKSPGGYAPAEPAQGGTFSNV